MPNDFDNWGIGFEDDGNLTVEGRQRRLMPLFLLVDTSGSMSGAKIEQVKDAIEQIKLELSMQNNTNEDAEIRVSVLCFDSGVEWKAQFEEPANLNVDFCAEGLTSMGAAFMELDKLLTRSAFKNAGDFSEFRRAVMILLTDGVPTDDVSPGIKRLRTNNWFVKGTRVAFAIGQDAEMSPLKEFTGNIEAVLQVDKISTLGRLLANVGIVSSVTATRLAGGGTDEGLNQAQKDRDFMTTAGETAEMLIDVGEQMIATQEIDVAEAEDIFAGGWC